MISWSAKDEYPGNYIIKKNRKGHKDQSIVRRQAMRQKKGTNFYTFKDKDVLPEVIYEYEIIFRDDKKQQQNTKSAASTERN